jgi:hypothetical protein
LKAAYPPCSRRLALFALVFLGCQRPEGDSLVIATPWPPAERAALEAAYRDAHPSYRPIAWVVLAPGDDPARLVPDLGVDVVLGVPSTDLDKLTAAGALAAYSESDARLWRIARRSTLGIAVDSGLVESLASPRLDSLGIAGRVALEDPRGDPITLAWAKARLAAEGWPKGYGELVRTSSNAARFGRFDTTPKSLPAGMAAKPAVGVVGAFDDRSTLVRLPGAPTWIEGVALTRNVRRDAEARAFLALLEERHQCEAVPANTPEVGPIELAADDLLADLLGATLVDAQDELWTAESALDRAGRPEPFNGYLDDPPPWPPTSVAKLHDHSEGAALLETLAREITADRDARFWLVESWDRPPRAIDSSWLREVAAVAGGRLVKEPRFRAWLREEWVAWARQHYRRIAREAGRVSH